jgi:catechol 2,3-dioxygenase-like lactoylglutathione lyase family enzyme
MTQRHKTSGCRAIVALLAGIGLAASAHAAIAEDLPIKGFAEVEFRVSNAEKAIAFYQGVEGFKKVFEIKGPDGAPVIFFKVNDSQYIAVTPNLKPGEMNRFDHVALEVSDIEKTHKMVEDRGLTPTKIEKRADGNPIFSIKDLQGTTISFLQYADGSKQAALRGKYSDNVQVSRHIMHVGIRSVDRQADTAFFQDKLGLDQGRYLPGRHDEFLEPSARAVDLETKDPPIPDTSATHDQYVREQYGSIFHIGLEVPDIQAAKTFLQTRGHFSDARVAPHIGHNRHWLMNIFDPDGTRTEPMEPTLQPVTEVSPQAPRPPA